MEGRDTTKRTLVIGLGNPLMGDDAFGARVIARLRLAAPPLPPHVDLVDVHTDLLGQIDRFPAYERVVLVDALLVPEENAADAGRVLLLDEEAMQAWPEASPSAHQLSPLTAIRLFRSLHPQAATRIHLVGLCTSRISCGPGTNASPGILSAEGITAAARTVRELL